MAGCKFFNALSTSVSLTGGGQWSFRNCDWTSNAGLAVATSDIAELTFDQCYAEQNSHATMLTLCQATGAFAIVKHRNWSIVNNTAPHIFGWGGTQKMILDGNVISLGATDHVLYDNGTTLTTIPSGVVSIKNHYVTGNSSDETARYSGFVEGSSTTWTPAPTSLTIVNGSGAVSYAGYYQIVGSQCHFNFKIITTSNATTASTAGTTLFAPISGLPLPVQSGSFTVADEGGTAGTSLGTGTIKSGDGKFYTPTWSARAGSIAISGSFFI